MIDASTAKIALVTLDYPPERGGVARYLGNLVQEAKGGMDVFVPETHEVTGPGKVEAVRMLRSFRPHWFPLIGFIRSLKGRGYRQVFLSHILPVGTAAWIARTLGGPKYSVLLHGLDLRLVNASRRKQWLARRILKGAEHVFCNSNFVAGEVKELEPKIDSIVLTPGVEWIEFPEREASRSELGVEAHDFLVLCVARLVPRKGIDTLIEVMKTLPEKARLVVVGAGDDATRLEGMAESLRERVRFIYQTTDEERNKWYAAADVFALPVRDGGSDVEGFGIVYLEAALAGLPAIAGKSGGATEAVVHEETGFVIDPDDAGALAQAMKRLMDDPDLREELGWRGRERAIRDFRWEDRWNKVRSSLLD